VFETRAGHGGVSGVEAVKNSRKFVIDFKGGLLAQLDGEAVVDPVVTVANGQILGTTTEKIAGTDLWRLVIEVGAQGGAVVELGAHIAGYDRKLTETWLYQWINAK
jgi:glucans biosynthesis protein